MNDFDKFIKIPDKEISGNTHILEEFIVYIKNKDYAKIKIRAHFHGFIYSISDEYGFDLKFLLEEYEQFHNPALVAKAKLEEQKKKEKESRKKLPKTDDIFLNKKEIEENKSNGNNYFIIIGIILSIVLAISWFIFKDDSKIDKKVLSTKQEQYAKYAKEEKEEKELSPLIKAEKKAIVKKKKEVFSKKKKKHTFNISKAKKLYKVKNGMLLLEPFRDNKLWLGLIDLNTKKQIGNVVRGLVSYKLKSNTIISTGHGYFNFINKNKDKSIKYRTFDKLFFYYKNGFLYQIKKEDVLALNGGFVW